MIGDLWYVPIEGRKAIKSLYLEIPSRNPSIVACVKITGFPRCYPTPVPYIKVVYVNPVNVKDKICNVLEDFQIDLNQLSQMIISKDRETNIMARDIIHNLFKNYLDECIKRQCSTI